MTKYLRIASDLHLEGFQGRNPDILMLDFLPKDERDADSILILAGDISSAPTQLAFFLRACVERFSHVIFVPGNHEYYKHNYDAWNRKMGAELHGLNQLEQGKLHFSTKGVERVIINGTRFIFGTMWGDGGPTLADQATTGRYLNDFRLIQRDDPLNEYPRRFTVPDMIGEFKEAKRAITAHLEETFEGTTVVVTHHLPSRRLVSARFWPGDGSDGANGGFVGQCDDLLARTEIAPKLWIHGHTHDTVDRELWNTRIVCNPAGYRGEYASEFNTFMKREPREDGTFRAVPVPKFVGLP